MPQTTLLTKLRYISDDKKRTIDYLMSVGLLRSAIHCTKCGKPMKLQERKYPSDGYAWRCCAVISVRKGSFFEKVHISLSNYILIIYAWAQNNRIDLL